MLDGQQSSEKGYENTQLIWIDTRYQLTPEVSISELQLQSMSISFYNAVADLEDIVVAEVTMEDHVVKLCQLCNYRLRQLRLIWSPLTPRAKQSLVLAFISSRLNDCNSLLFDVQRRLYKKLQCVEFSSQIHIKPMEVQSHDMCSRICTGYQNRKRLFPSWPCWLTRPSQSSTIVSGKRFCWSQQSQEGSTAFCQQIWVATWAHMWCQGSKHVTSRFLTF